jgi:hypothetical protein
MKIIFWNLKKQKSFDELVILVESYNPDCILIAESELNIDNVANIVDYTHVKEIIDKKPKISFFFNPRNILSVQIIQEYKKRLYAYRVKSSESSFTIIGVHLGSKINFDKENQLCESIDYMDQIKNIEKTIGCHDTIVIGDFNMNPFDTGMIAGNAFNSVLSEKIAREGNRTIQRKKYEYFFNPSWKLYGTSELGYGTYFLENPNHTSFHWNIYDQVLIRPSILEKYIIDYSVINDEMFFSTEKEAAFDHKPICTEMKRR